MELVDREKLIAQYSANPESKGFIELIQDDCVVLALQKAEVIEAVPVVHGRWEQHCFEIECSKCNGEALRNAFNQYVFSSYCPNCGAKMDLE